MSSLDEKVDVVDKNGKILSQTTKGEAHENGLLHKCVIAEVINSKGDIALVKQAPDRQDPGQYVSPVGGHVMSGESEENALLREAAEELGIADFEYKLVGRAAFDRHVIGRHENHLFCVYEILHDGPFTLNHESVGIKFFSKDALRRILKEEPEKIGDASHFIIDNFYTELK